MIIAILSDIHDRQDHLRRALELAGEAEVLLCLGDLCAPFIVPELADGFSGPIHLVFGNNDGDPFRISAAAAPYSHLTIHGEYAELELSGLRFAINHFDHIGTALARGQTFDVVCFGHNHRYEDRVEGRTRVLNPGEIYGMRSGTSTFMLFDSMSRQVRRMEI